MWWSFKRTVFGILVRTSNRLFGKEIVHRYPLAGWLNRIWLALSELVSPSRRRQARFERQNPDSPWFVPAAVSYIEGKLRPDFVGFEWGCGRSTLWFARRVRHLTSVEGRRAWFDEVASWVAKEELGTRVTLCLAEVSTEHGFIHEEIERYAGAIDGVDDGSLDFIVVDGHFREACLRRIGKKLRPGGMLIVDNSEVVPKSVMETFNAAEIRAWNNGIWETSVIC